MRRIGFQIHGHVQRQAVVSAVAADLDAQRAILPRPVKSGSALGRQRAAAGAGAAGRGCGVVQPHVDAGCARHAVAGDADMRQRADHGFLDAVDVFLDVVAGALQVHQRVATTWPGAVVGDLAARLVATTGMSPGFRMWSLVPASPWV